MIVFLEDGYFSNRKEVPEKVIRKFESNLRQDKPSKKVKMFKDLLLCGYMVTFLIIFQKKNKYEEKKMNSVIYVMWLRQLKRYWRSKARMIGTLGQPILFLVALGFTKLLMALLMNVLYIMQLRQRLVQVHIG